MTECEDYELAIEMRQRMTLEPALAQALELHLGSCARFVTSTPDVERRLAAMTTANVDGTSWEQIRARLQNGARNDRLAVAATLLAPVLQLCGGVVLDALLTTAAPS